MDLYDKLDGFVESEMSKQETVCTKIVKNVNESVRADQNLLYIVSVKQDTEAYKQMRERLESLGIRNVMDSEDVIENFYSICG